MTGATSEDGPSIENRNPTTTTARRTTEPGTTPTEVAIAPVQLDRVFHRPPLAAVFAGAIDQCEAILADTHSY
jgi:hypothetical protein